MPDFDDGSRNLQESLHMLRMESEQGVEKIVLTPHFYASQDAVSSYLERREKRYQSLLQEISKEEGLPELELGAEVYYFPGIGKAAMLPQFCIYGTNTILIELPFAQWTEEMYKDIWEIVEKRKMTVVLAHVERYYGLQKKREIWNRIFELPLYAQFNTGSFSDKRKQKICFRFFKKHDRFVLGSDCHDTEYRPPNLLEGRCAIEKKLGTGFLVEIDRKEEKALMKNHE